MQAQTQCFNAPQAVQLKASLILNSPQLAHLRFPNPTNRLNLYLQTMQAQLPDAILEERPNILIDKSTDR
ncbi:12871_t:CDS:2 [Dentiscutata erythropus]|uniref:12871_t:CDS:1 n=1 Tax=Dentiscutata erythropus TaxID=1348616 RepID=A0A9N9BQD0_9GLOM|nr:12871_t:CDS:2 [Dentiscutata erythropus]